MPTLYEQVQFLMEHPLIKKHNIGFVFEVSNRFTHIHCSDKPQKVKDFLTNEYLDVKDRTLTNFYKPYYFDKDDLSSGKINLNKLLSSKNNSSCTLAQLCKFFLSISVEKDFFLEWQDYPLMEIYKKKLQKQPLTDKDLKLLATPLQTDFFSNSQYTSFEPTERFLENLLIDNISIKDKKDIIVAIETLINHSQGSPHNFIFNNILNDIAVYKFYYEAAYNAENKINDNSHLNQQLEELFKKDSTFSFKSNRFKMQNLSQYLEEVKYFDEFPDSLDYFYDKELDSSVFKNVFKNNEYKYTSMIDLSINSILHLLEKNQAHYLGKSYSSQQELVMQLSCTANIYLDYADVKVISNHTDVIQIMIFDDKPIEDSRYRQHFMEALLAYKTNADIDYDIKNINAIFQENILKKEAPSHSASSRPAKKY